MAETNCVQESVLGPILFLLYTADLIKLVKVRDLHPHLYANDTQLYGFCSPDRALALRERVIECISDRRRFRVQEESEDSPFSAVL